MMRRASRGRAHALDARSARIHGNGVSATNPPTAAIARDATARPPPAVAAATIVTIAWRRPRTREGLLKKRARRAKNAAPERVQRRATTGEHASGSPPSSAPSGPRGSLSSPSPEGVWERRLRRLHCRSARTRTDSLLARPRRNPWPIDPQGSKRPLASTRPRRSRRRVRAMLVRLRRHPPPTPRPRDPRPRPRASK